MPKLIEALEGRRLLATVTWDGGGSPSRSFSTPANWSNDQIPTSVDDVVVPASTDTGFLSVDTPVAFKSLTVSRFVYMTAATNIATELRVTATGRVVLPSGGSVIGTGKIIVDAGGSFSGDATSQHGGNVRVPVDNYGTFGIIGGMEYGPDFHNYGRTALVENGDTYGVLTNEASGIITSTYVPNAPGYVSIGLQRSPSGVISSAPIVNKGTIWAGSDSPSGFHQDLTIYVDGTSQLGGTWKAPYMFSLFNTPLHFRSKTGAATLEFDSTANLSGQIDIGSGINATVRGLADNSILTVGGNVTLAQPRASLEVLDLSLISTLKMQAGSVVRAADFRLGANSRLDVADGLFIDGNQPGVNPDYRPKLVNPQPAVLPAYQASIRGNVNGEILTVNTGVDASASLSRGVGFSTGASLAAHYTSHTFRGETFDGDDFVFFPTLRGDVNFDREVEFIDLLVLVKRYGTNTSGGYAYGNFDNPANAGAIDFDDLVLLAQNYGVTFAIAPPITLKPSPAAAKRRGELASELTK